MEEEETHEYIEFRFTAYSERNYLQCISYVFLIFFSVFYFRLVQCKYIQIQKHLKT